jgi:hypothetical protein
MNSDGEIDSTKCNALGKFPYYALKEELEVEQQLRIEVETLIPKETVCLWGGNPDSSSVSFESQRYLLYNDSSKSIPAVLTVTVYEGKTPNDNLYLTEIMHSPTNTGFGYEWIEFYNPNDIAIYVNKWSISDSDERDNIIPGDTEIITIPAKSVGILTSAPSTFKSTYVDYKYTFSVEDLSIGNGLGVSETVTLSRNYYNDAISYTADDGANENGKSLTRSCYNCDDWNEAVPSAGSI